MKALNLPKSIWAIGIMTLFMNISTVIIFSLSPLYLTKVLGISMVGVGMFEGIVEFISWMTRVFSGVVSDALRKRKPLLVTAIVMTCFARPLFALASTVYGVFASRAIDRVANGLQASPRDALIGDSVQKSKVGSAFGLRQSLGTLGSAAGAILTYFWLLNSEVSEYETMFWIASAFPFAALLFIVFFVKDVPRNQKKADHQSTDESSNPQEKSRFNFSYVRTLSPDYWRTLAVAFVFCLSTFSGSFMILQGEHVTHMASIGPAVMIAQNTFAMLVAYPLGRLFDRFDHRKLLAIGFSSVMLASFVLSQSSTFTLVIIGACLWGVQMGVNQSLLTATISSCTTKSNRATGFGIYYITAGSAIFISNTVIGSLAKLYGLDHAFWYSVIIAFIAILCLPLLRSRCKVIATK